MNDQLDTAPADDGERGLYDGAALEISSNRPRKDILFLRRAAVNGWDIKQESYDRLPAICAAIIADPGSSKRERMAAIRAIQSMDKNRLSAIALHDRITRLDAGLPTEVVDHNIRVTKSVASRVLTDPKVQAQAQKMHEMIKAGDAA